MTKADHYLTQIREFISRYEPGKEPANLYEPLVYALRQGGKHLRPVLTLLSCDMFGGNTDDALGCAMGIEVFHNFTLVHDDIMDQAPHRRGRPTVYKKWNPNIAILSGDTMFACAVELFLKSQVKNKLEALEVFTRTAVEVCEGQQYDMDFETRNNIILDDYMEMIRLKTAVLLGASVKIGAIAAGASQQDTENIYRFGMNLGLAFQIMDDLLDTFGDEEKFGKQKGGDIVANKKTWLYLKALELASAGQKLQLHDLYKPDNPIVIKEKIELVTGIFNTLGIREKTLAEMEKYYTVALHHLDMIKTGDAGKADLKDYASRIFNREY